MARFIVFGTLLMAVVLPPASLAQSSLPREGTGTATGYYTSSSKTLSMGARRTRVAYESSGILVNDAGQGFLHQMTAKCFGGRDVVDGAWDNEQGSCVAIDRDGDQVFFLFTATGSPGGSSTATAKIAGGTGKYTGVSGGWEIARMALRPVEEGAGYSLNKLKYSYRLP